MIARFPPCGYAKAVEVELNGLLFPALRCALGSTPAPGA
jgi:hypothetical protein